jgi:general secretion pathway protein A
MFLEYYNFIEQPFGVTPDPRFLYLNHMYREALALLWYGIKERRGFLALVAQPGMGKTTLLLQLLRRLRIDSARTVFLFQTCCDSLDVIRHLLLDMNICPASDVASMHHQLNGALEREARAGKQVVFVIDEAQNLSEPVLETVRLLSDFETPHGKLLQIILAGQPPLVRTLLKPEMLQLRQRISMTAFLNSLTSNDVALYIDHRIRVAGYQGLNLFTRKAVELIAHESQGIPRNINHLCFGALTAGMALRRKKIDREVVEEVAAEQNLNYSRAPTAKSAAINPPAISPVDGPRVASTQVTAQVPRAALLAAMTGLLMLAVVFLWSKKPQLVAYVSAENRPRTALVVPSEEIASPVEKKAPVKALKPALASELPLDLPHDVTVTVRRGDDLRGICLTYLGRYSTRIVQHIQALNPELVDPDRIEVGQQIRLPSQEQRRSNPPYSNAEPRIASSGR